MEIGIRGCENGLLRDSILGISSGITNLLEVANGLWIREGAKMSHSLTGTNVNKRIRVSQGPTIVICTIISWAGSSFDGEIRQIPEHS